MYDRVLRLIFPDEVRVVGYVDDIAVVVVANLQPDCKGHSGLETITLTIEGCAIISQRYLGIELDDRLTFKRHLQITSEKAA